MAEKMVNFHSVRYLCVLIVLSILSAFTKTADAIPAVLPDALNEWRRTSVQTTEFTTTKDGENFGQWENCVYTRSAPIASVETNLMDGSGPGTLFVPEGASPGNEISTNDAPIGFSSTYETMYIAGKRAILESGEITGLALAVALGKDRTLTLETKSLLREELFIFAQKMIAALEEK